MIVIALTSWVKRIHNVKKIVESIMDNTIQPDRVYLNLSKSEFKDIELPEDLVEYFNSDDRLIINWVSGPNTKSMKKIFPILGYLDDEDIIIDADDDILFPKDLIESRITDFEKYGRKYCITSNTHTSVGFNGKMKVVSAISLFQKKMLKHWKKFVTQTVIDTGNDDRTYLHLLWLHGYLNKECSKWSIYELLKDYDMNLDNKLSSSGFKRGRNYDIVVQRDFLNRFGKNIITSFGFLK